MLKSMPCNIKMVMLLTAILLSYGIFSISYSENKINANDAKQLESPPLDSLIIEKLKTFKEIKEHPRFNGHPIWANRIFFYVKGNQLTDLREIKVKELFGSKNVPISQNEVYAIVNFIGYLSLDAAKFKGKKIDLVKVLAELRKQ